MGSSTSNPSLVNNKILLDDAGVMGIIKTSRVNGVNYTSMEGGLKSSHGKHHQEEVEKCCCYDGQNMEDHQGRESYQQYCEQHEHMRQH